MWPLHHLRHPKKQRFYDSATEELVIPQKTNAKNQTTGATTPAQLLTTPSSPHSGKPRRGAALMYPNAPYFVMIGGTPIRIHNAHALWCGKWGTNQLMCCCRCTGFFDTAVAEYGKGRTFAESSGRSHVSEGKETREEGGHQTT